MVVASSSRDHVWTQEAASRQYRIRNIREEFLQRPFEGIRVIDATHVLAGPFAAYQLAVLGADVIKVEHPVECDQSRETGSDRALNQKKMGTSFLTQGSNKRSLTLDIKTQAGQDIFKKLIATADVLVENYRPGALEALGLGYDALSRINRRLIYASMSAFGETGPRRTHTAYDYIIQATSGIMAMTGTPEVNPIKFGSPAIDYATGTTGAFALASALFQRERTGKGQRIDMAMLDVAIILMGSHVTAYTRTGAHPKPVGNTNEYATNSCYQTKDGLLMLGASNMRQYRRIWQVLGKPEMIRSNREEREHARASEIAALTEILLTRTADEWEEFFQSRHVPAARVRTLGEALADPHLETRGVRHKHSSSEHISGEFTTPVTAFRLAEGGARIDTPPPALGQHSAEILGSLGYDAAYIAQLRSDGVI
jgi:crotonobetainyl-CoA:carnitine CoA-transferase CaiB-like acyl-CoA transferase